VFLEVRAFLPVSTAIYDDSPIIAADRDLLAIGAECEGCRGYVEIDPVGFREPGRSVPAIDLDSPHHERSTGVGNGDNILSRIDCNREVACLQAARPEKRGEDVPVLQIEHLEDSIPGSPSPAHGNSDRPPCVNRTTVQHPVITEGPALPVEFTFLFNRRRLDAGFRFVL
jgi:hypothetical protein